MEEKKPLIEQVKSSLLAFLPVLVLAILAVWLSQWTPFKVYGLEYVFWAIVFGLLISNTIGFPEKLKAGLKTEAFIKIGLVPLGAEIVFGKILAIGVTGFCRWTMRAKESCGIAGCGGKNKHVQQCGRIFNREALKMHVMLKMQIF